MPQGHATQPFKAPLDESKVIIEWKKYTDQWGNKFPDGESYDLEYPEVTLAADAVYAKNEGVISSLGNYKVLLESTIGIYGTAKRSKRSFLQKWRMGKAIQQYESHRCQS